MASLVISDEQQSKIIDVLQYFSIHSSDVQTREILCNALIVITQLTTQLAEQTQMFNRQRQDFSKQLTEQTRKSNQQRKDFSKQLARHTQQLDQLTIQNNRQTQLLIGLNKDLHQLKALSIGAVQEFNQDRIRSIINPNKDALIPGIAVLDVSNCVSQKNIYDKDNKWPRLYKVIEGQHKHIKNTCEELTKENAIVLFSKYHPNGITYRSLLQRKLPIWIEKYVGPNGTAAHLSIGVFGFAQTISNGAILVFFAETYEIALATLPEVKDLVDFIQSLNL